MIAALNRMHRRALKQGRHLAGAAPHELHKLRIMLKNLRYACEVLAPLLPAGRKEAAFMKSLQALLVLLGHCNDIAAMNGMMLEIPLSAQPELHQAAGFVLGWNAHEYAAAQLALAKLWKDFAGRKAFWA
jgi:CHAD domain-containing protein